MTMSDQGTRCSSYKGAALAKLTPAIRTSALLAMLATTGEAWAAMAPATLPELGREATIVALGRVEGREGRWSEDRSAIRTDVTAVVLRAVKGEARPGGGLSSRGHGRGDGGP